MATVAILQRSLTWTQSMEQTLEAQVKVWSLEGPQARSENK